MENDERPPQPGPREALQDDDDFTLKGGLEDLKPPPDVVQSRLEDYAVAGRVLKRRRGESLAEAAQITVDERDAARAQLAATRGSLIFASASAEETPDVISWDSRGLRLRRYLENASIKLVRYAAKVGSVSFDLAVSCPHPNKYDATLTVELSSGAGQYSTSNQMVVFRREGATVALAAEEAMRDCDIRLLTLAHELTWGLK